MAVTPRLPAETGQANRPSPETRSPRRRLRCGALAFRPLVCIVVSCGWDYALHYGTIDGKTLLRILLVVRPPDPDVLDVPLWPPRVLLDGVV